MLVLCVSALARFVRFGQQLALRSRALGCPALYGAAGAEPGCASGRQPGVLCVLSGSFFMQCGGLLSLAPSLFHRHWGQQ